MDIQDLLNEIANKLPRIREIIYQIRFEKIKMAEDIAFLQGTTIFYTDKLLSDFSFDEQVFIIAHEIMHYLIHMYDNNKKLLKYDKDLLNFTEDAQINQILISQHFIPPKDIIILKDALNYSFEELYNKLYNIKKELLYKDNWANFSSVTELEALSQHQLNPTTYDYGNR